MSELDIGVKLVGFYIDWPVMNGAGSCRTIEEVRSLARSNIPIVMSGSFTKEKRGENKGETFWYDDWFSLNSRGLPNLGSEVFDKIIPEMAAIVHQAGKLLAISVAGFTPQEYALLAKLAFAAGADIVELNLSCPNVWEGNRQKRIACFYPDLVKEILKCVEEAVGSEAKVFVKLSPFSIHLY